MKVAIHQPEHLPWLGFFNKMSMADIYVIFDDVQFEKNNFQNRNRIMGTNGPQWLGIPVNLSGHATDKINEIGWFPLWNLEEGISHTLNTFV